MWKKHKPIFSDARGIERFEKKKTIQRPIKFKEIFEIKKSNIRNAKKLLVKVGSIKPKEADNAWMFEGKKSKW